MNPVLECDSRCLNPIPWSQTRSGLTARIEKFLTSLRIKIALQRSRMPGTHFPRRVVRSEGLAPHLLIGEAVRRFKGIVPFLFLRITGNAKC